MARIKIVGLLFCFAIFCTPVIAESPKAKSDAPQAVSQGIAAPSADQIADDIRSIAIFREGLAGVVQFIRSRSDLFPAAPQKGGRIPSLEERKIVRSTWISFTDYCLALDALQRVYAAFYALPSEEARRSSFKALYGAFVAQYRYALEILSVLENDPALGVILDEPDSESGLKSNTYSAFKKRFLSVIIATEFAALNTTYNHYGKPFIVDGLNDDGRVIWRMGKGKGVSMTMQNAGKIIQNVGFGLWFPVQQGVSEWMGDTKVWRMKRSLITTEQIADLLALLEPGDILLERREWYLSNIGLPGFWPHAGLYVGTAEERYTYFAGDYETSRWLEEQGIESGDFEKLIQAKYPESYTLFLTGQEQAHLPRVIEAMSEGVVPTTIEHSAACDSLAVLRPRLSKLEKARAIAQAFYYQGRPYDFNFDFLTDSSLVCTELVYKSYFPTKDFKGLNLPTIDLLGRQVLPANELVRQFDQSFSTPQQQFDLILFYDGIERLQKAENKSVEEFRSSWKRPKWHIWMPNSK